MYARSDIDYEKEFLENIEKSGGPLDQKKEPKTQSRLVKGSSFAIEAAYVQFSMNEL